MCSEKDIFYEYSDIWDDSQAGGEETICIQSLSNASQKTLFTLSWSDSAVTASPSVIL